jgi:hypothetical protein
MPPSGKTVVTDVWTYLQATASVAAVQSQAQLASWTIAQLMANTSGPSSINGGMGTIDPVTGVPLLNDQVRYSINRPIAAIQADLADKTRTLTATSVYAPDTDGPSLRYTIEYPGYTLVPIIAAPWSSGNAGWFLSGPIASAYGNQDKNVTGFHFVADAGKLQPFAFGGTFGMVTNVLISDDPIVTVEIAPATTRKLAASARDNLAILRPLGLAADQRVLRVQTRAAAMALASVPLLMQTAYVMGCTISNPAASA